MFLGTGSELGNSDLFSQVCVPSPDLDSVEWLDSHCIPSSLELGERKGAAVSSCLSVRQAPSMLDAPVALEACYLLLSFGVAFNLIGSIYTS